MKIKSERKIEELRDVLLDKESKGPETAYWVFDEVSQGKWENMTVTAPGTYGKEFPKTYGHYHSTPVPETYKLIQGEGFFLLQKKYLDEQKNNEWDIDRVSEVILVKLEIGEEITINPEWGHSWINVGKEPLVTFDDWRSGHQFIDYLPIKRFKGLAYYVVKEDDGSIGFVPNSNYKDLPSPKVINLKEYIERYA